MNYLIENMKNTDKDTRITQASKFAGRLAFSLALSESFKTLELAREEGSTPIEDINALKELILMTVITGSPTVGEA